MSTYHQRAHGLTPSRCVLATRNVCLSVLTIVLTILAFPAMLRADLAMMMAARNLVPTSEATHIATGGDWNASSSWQGGSVPSSGAKVHIPQNVTMTYDVGPVGAPDLTWLRVDGNLLFANDQDTRMNIDTIVIDTTGHMTVGTQPAPIPANRTAEIMFPTGTFAELTGTPISRDGFVLHRQRNSRDF